MRLRPVIGEDRAFLVEMLVEAVNWTAEQRIERPEVEANPHLRCYLADWPRDGDFGWVAIDVQDAPVGAAWARTFRADDAGYGFVAEDIPELTMAVVASHRGQGVGRRLLEALIADARKRGWRAISLSVEDGNRAQALYRAAGFETVGRVDNADTMLLMLTSNGNGVVENSA